MSYKDQDKEIQKLLKSISKKSKGFASRKHETPYYNDLQYVLSELKEINKFLK
jgi:hypothetical protein